jgi:hypothetical protein
MVLVDTTGAAGSNAVAFSAWGAWTQHEGVELRGPCIVALLGMPCQNMGYSPEVGRRHRVNPIPNMSVYDLKLSGNQYLHNGQQLELKVVEHRVAVRIAGVLYHPCDRSVGGLVVPGLGTSVEELFKIHDRAPLPMFNMIEIINRFARPRCSLLYLRQGSLGYRRDRRTQLTSLA